jgi:hypothetical protein
MDAEMYRTGPSIVAPIHSAQCSGSTVSIESRTRSLHTCQHQRSGNWVVTKKQNAPCNDNGWVQYSNVVSQKFFTSSQMMPWSGDVGSIQWIIT